MNKFLRITLLASTTAIMSSGCSFLGGGGSNDPATRQVTDLKIVDTTEYTQGMVFRTDNNISVSAIYNTDPKEVLLKTSEFSILSMKDPDDLSARTTDPLAKVGNYIAKIKYKTITKDYVFTVKEASESSDILLSVKISTTKNDYKVEDVFSSFSDHKVVATWKYRGDKEIPYNADGVIGYKFLTYGTNKCSDPNGNSFDPKTEFLQPGVHKIAVEYKGVASSSLSVSVAMNAVSFDRITAYQLTPIGTPTIDNGDTPKIALANKYKVKVTYKKSSNPAETLNYEENIKFDSSLYSVKVVEKGYDVDLSNTALTTQKDLQIYVYNPDSTSIKSSALDLKVDGVLKKENNKYNYYRVNNSDNVNPYGNQKVLVIPTYFSADSSATSKANSSNWNRIQKGFFGTNEECGWKSFTGYYNAMSYGQLNYSGYISPVWYRSDTYTLDQLKASEEPSKTIAAYALKWFKEQNPTFDFTDYDTNNDGYVDSLYIIYASDYIGGDDSGVFWGYRWSTNVSSGTGIQARAFSWFSMKFLNNTDSYGGVPAGGINTRIITHEHGHMLGLPDYYDYGYSGVDYVGSWDMQSNNRLDWNAYSKYATGYVKPYYPVLSKLTNGQEIEVTMGDCSSTGDCLIIPTSQWNGSAFGEYIMIELFNPDAPNNAYDASNLGLGYGVKIYHVNSTIFEYMNNGNVYDGGDFHSDSSVYMRDHIYTNDYNTYDKYNSYHSYYDYLTNQNVTRQYKILRLLQKGNTSTFDKTSSRNQWQTGDLWQTGDTFTVGAKTGYTNYGPNFFVKTSKMDNGENFKFGITFNSVTKTSVSLTLKYFA